MNVNAELPVRKKPRQLLVLLGLYSVFWLIGAVWLYAIFAQMKKNSCGFQMVFTSILSPLIIFVSI